MLIAWIPWSRCLVNARNQPCPFVGHMQGGGGPSLATAPPGFSPGLSSSSSSRDYSPVPPMVCTACTESFFDDLHVLLCCCETKKKNRVKHRRHRTRPVMRKCVTFSWWRRWSHVSTHLKGTRQSWKMHWLQVCTSGCVSLNTCMCVYMYE